MPTFCAFLAKILYTAKKGHVFLYTANSHYFFSLRPSKSNTAKMPKNGRKKGRLATLRPSEWRTQQLQTRLRNVLYGLSRRNQLKSVPISELLWLRSGSGDKDESSSAEQWKSQELSSPVRIVVFQICGVDNHGHVR